MRRLPPGSTAPQARPIPIPAPVGGWNARDSLANMPATDAIILDNMFPRTTDVMARRGIKIFATLPDDTVISPHNIRGLMGYKSPSGTVKLFAGTEAGIYDITAGGAISAIASPATGSQWNSAMVTTPGGSFLWCCNGQDDSRYFDGSAWHILNGASTPSLTGVTSNTIQDIFLFKSRLFLVPKASMSVWYLGVNAIAGAATEFPVGELFDLGGSIAQVGAWTVDAGNGPDDYFCILTTEGELAVYKGTNPSSSTDWALVGVYVIPKPLGTRCMFKYGGDLCVITNNGILPLSTALLSATIDRSKALTDKINQAFNSYAEGFGAEFGWQSAVYSEASMLLINVPLKFQRSCQFVMNTITKAWCRFTGWNAEVMAVLDGKLYLAANNIVYQAWTEYNDFGGAIDIRVKTAFNHFRNPGILKQISLLQPVFTASASVAVSIGIDGNYEDNNLASSASNYVQNLAVFNQSYWNEAVWSSSSLTVAKWKSVNHKPSQMLALRLRFSLKNVNLTWMATNFILQNGGLM